MVAVQGLRKEERARKNVTQMAKWEVKAIDEKVRSCCLCLSDSESDDCEVFVRMLVRRIYI